MRKADSKSTFRRFKNFSPNDQTVFLSLLFIRVVSGGEGWRGSCEDSGRKTVVGVVGYVSSKDLIYKSGWLVESVVLVGINIFNAISSRDLTTNAVMMAWSLFTRIFLYSIFNSLFYFVFYILVFLLPLFPFLLYLQLTSFRSVWFFGAK